MERFYVITFTNQKGKLLVSEEFILNDIFNFLDNNNLIVKNVIVVYLTVNER